MAKATQRRHCNGDAFDMQLQCFVIEIIQRNLHLLTPYEEAFLHKSQAEQEQHWQAAARSDEVSVVHMQPLWDNHDPKGCNAPIHSDVATVFAANDEGVPPPFDVLVPPLDAPPIFMPNFKIMLKIHSAKISYISENGAF